MKTDQLAYFLEVARWEHVGKAARALSISPSAVSHSVAALEAELGCALFERQGKRIFLSPHGKRFQARAERVLEDLKRLKDEMSSPDIAWEEEFRLAATHVLAATRLAPAWAKLQTEQPGMKAELLSLRSAEVVARAVAGEIDLGLCLSPQANPAIEILPAGRDELVIAVRAGHPVLRLPAAKRVEALSRFPAAAPKAFQGIEPCETHPLYARLCLTPRIDFVFDSYDVVTEYLTVSDAWSLIPRFCVKASEQRLKEPLSGPTNRGQTDISLVVPRGRHRSRGLRRLIELVQNPPR